MRKGLNIVRLEERSGLRRVRPKPSPRTSRGRVRVRVRERG